VFAHTEAHMPMCICAMSCSNGKLILAYAYCSLSCNYLVITAAKSVIEFVSSWNMKQEEFKLN